MTSWNIDKIIELLKQAAAVAMKYYDAPEKELKSDYSVVTIADKEIENLVCTYLDKPDQGSYVIGEETVDKHDETYIHEAFENTAWIVDPIDGTAPYANHLPTWGISLGMMQNKTLKEGAMFLPAFNEVYISDGDNVLWGQALPAEWSKSDLQILEIKEKPFDGTSLISISQMIAKKGQFTAKNPVHAVCSCVYSLARVLHGEYQTYLGTIKLWDLAGGLPILLKCGLAAKFYETRENVELSVDATSFVLEKDHQYRWYAKDHIIFGRNSEVIDFMINNLCFKNK